MKDVLMLLPGGVCWVPTVPLRCIPSLGPSRLVAVGMRDSGPWAEDMSRVAAGSAAPVPFLDLPNKKAMVRESGSDETTECYDGRGSEGMEHPVETKGDLSRGAGRDAEWEWAGRKVGLRSGLLKGKRRKASH